MDTAIDFKSVRGRAAWSAALLGCSLLTLAAAAQAAGQHAATATAAASKRASPYHPLRTPTRAKDYYVSIWGVDNFLVRRTASTNLVRFSYRVVDPARAATLGDEHFKPELVAPARGVALQVPSMEQIGDLRQKGKPVAGKEYWMVFSNKGNLVRPGDRVSVVIGSFHVDGLVVQ